MIIDGMYKLIRSADMLSTLVILILSMLGAGCHRAVIAINDSQRSVTDQAPVIYIFLDRSNWRGDDSDSIRLRIGTKEFGVAKEGSAAVCRFIRRQPRNGIIYLVLGADPELTTMFNGATTIDLPFSDYPDEANIFAVARDMNDVVDIIELEVPQLRAK